MATLKPMPAIELKNTDLASWGACWLGKTSSNEGKEKNEQCFDKKQGMDFSKTCIDPAVAKALSVMLGDIRVEKPINGYALLPPKPDCVEIGDTRVIGGIRPQNFDIAYRPDGLRIVYDSKSLNDASSIRKNWQNMINDLATEATTVHTRFPYAIVIFVIVVPRPALSSAQEYDIIRTLERMATRRSVLDQNHLAEAISLIIWDPATGNISSDSPSVSSNLRIEKLSEIIYPIYLDRYKGLPPHDKT